MNGLCRRRRPPQANPPRKPSVGAGSVNRRPRRRCFRHPQLTEDAGLTDLVIAGGAPFRRRRRGVCCIWATSPSISAGSCRAAGRFDLRDSTQPSWEPPKDGPRRSCCVVRCAISSSCPRLPDGALSPVSASPRHCPHPAACIIRCTSPRGGRTRREHRCRTIGRAPGLTDRSPPMRGARVAAAAGSGWPITALLPRRLELDLAARWRDRWCARLARAWPARRRPPAAAYLQPDPTVTAGSAHTIVAVITDDTVPGPLGIVCAIRTGRSPAGAPGVLRHPRLPRRLTACSSTPYLLRRGPSPAVHRGDWESDPQRLAALGSASVRRSMIYARHRGLAADARSGLACREPLRTGFRPARFVRRRPCSRWMADNHFTLLGYRSTALARALF